MDSILTITAPATKTDIITLDDILTDLGIDDTGNNQPFFDDIASVSAAIVGFIGRSLALATYSETFRQVYGRHVLLLAQLPVVSIASIIEDGSTLSAQDYEIDAESGMLYRLSGDCRICWSASKIVVAYSAGYKMPGVNGFQKGGDGSVPPDVQKAALIACRALYNARGSDPMVKRESIPGVAEEERWVGTDPGQGGSGLPTETERLLSRYRDIFVG